MIKEGDMLICKQDYLDFFQKESYYIVIEIQPFFEQINVKKAYCINGWNTFWFSTNKDSRSYIWNYFITLAEWREMQINSILDGD